MFVVDIGYRLIWGLYSKTGFHSYIIERMIKDND